MSTKFTTYHISISTNDIWSGDGEYDHDESGENLGSIRDCAAILGGDQETAEDIYSAIEDEINNMDSPGGGSIEYDGNTYSWTLTR